MNTNSESANTNTDSIRKCFASWARAQIGNIYVWGGQGETQITEAWIRRMESDPNNAERVIAFWHKRQSEGATQLAAYDCSGLLVKFLLEKGIVHSDMTSRGLFAICEEIKKDKLVQGDLVFRHNGTQIHHVGLYVGDGKVVHARGRDYGVVEETFDQNGASYWNRFGRIKNMPLEETLEQDDANEYPKAMEYSGKTYVHLRSEPSTKVSANIIGRIENGVRVIVLSVSEDGGWGDVILREGRGFKRGYCVMNWLKDTVCEAF